MYRKSEPVLIRRLFFWQHCTGNIPVVLFPQKLLYHALVLCHTGLLTGSNAGSWAPPPQQRLVSNSYSVPTVLTHPCGVALAKELTFTCWPWLKGEGPSCMFSAMLHAAAVMLAHGGLRGAPVTPTYGGSVHAAPSCLCKCPPGCTTGIAPEPTEDVDTIRSARLGYRRCYTKAVGCSPCHVLECGASMVSQHDVDIL